MSVHILISFYPSMPGMMRFAFILFLLTGQSAASAQARSRESAQDDHAKTHQAAITLVADRQLSSQSAQFQMGNLALRADSAAGLPHGIIGASVGAVVGGAVGYVRVGMNCETSCDATRSVLTGAVVGAAIGATLEFFIRHGRR